MVQIPFMVTPMFTGPLVEPLGFIDVAWTLRLIVSGLVHLILSRVFGKPEAPPLETAVAVER